MEQKTLSVVERKEFKKGPAKQLRSEGKIPAVVYGHTEPLHISVDAREFSRKFKVVSENTIINLELGDKHLEVLVKDIQEDIVTDTVKHIDFYEIEKGKTLKTHIPIHLEGSPVGVKEGGLLEHKLGELEVECLPKDLPEEIVVNLDGLDVGHSIHVGDLAEISGVTITAAANQTVVVVNHPKGAAATATEEAEAEEE